MKSASTYRQCQIESLENRLQPSALFPKPVDIPALGDPAVPALVAPASPVGFEVTAQGQLGPAKKGVAAVPDPGISSPTVPPASGGTTPLLAKNALPDTSARAIPEPDLVPENPVKQLPGVLAGTKDAPSPGTRDGR